MRPESIPPIKATALLHVTKCAGRYVADLVQHLDATLYIVYGRKVTTRWACCWLFRGSNGLLEAVFGLHARFCGFEKCGESL